MKVLSRIRVYRKRKQEEKREKTKLESMLFEIASEIRNVRIMCNSIDEGDCSSTEFIDLSVFEYSCRRRDFVKKGIPREYLSVIDEEMADATKNLKYCKIAYYHSLWEKLIFNKREVGA